MINISLLKRIRGYGYEIYLNSSMDDNDENRTKLIRFVAQEVKKDERIPHFDKDAVAEIIHEDQRRAGRKGKLSLRLRELGGLIRAAGDVAFEKGINL
jgi:Lon-like ATP-dependent protease